MGVDRTSQVTGDTSWRRLYERVSGSATRGVSTGATSHVTRHTSPVKRSNISISLLVARDAAGGGVGGGRWAIEREGLRRRVV